MAQRKFENFSEYYQLYPEYTHIFVGDNGQGDVRAAEIIVETYGNLVLQGGYFHIVTPLEKTFGYDDHARSRWARMNLVFFHTYVGAALEAFNRGHLRLHGLCRIATDAAKNFEENAHLFTSSIDREIARDALNVDLRKAQVVVNAQGTITTPLPMIPKPQVFEKYATVVTKFGRGQVVAYRRIEGIYEIRLHGWGGTVFTLEESLSYPKSLDCIYHDALVPTSSSSVQTSVQSSSVPAVLIIKAPGKLLKVPIGSLLPTFFGEAKVIHFREKQRIVVLSLATLCKNGECRFFLQQDLFEKKWKHHIDASSISFRASPIISNVRGFLATPFTFLLPPTLILCPIGTRVKSPFGLGNVIFQGKSSYVIEMAHVGTLVRAYAQHASVSEATTRTLSYDALPSNKQRNLMSLLRFTSSVKADEPLAVGNIVTSPFGNAIIRSLDSKKNYASLQLRRFHVKGPIAYCTLEKLSLFDDVVSKEYSTRIRNFFSRNSSSTVWPIVSETVMSPFGSGIVEKVSEKIITVRIVLGRGDEVVAYVQRTAVSEGRSTSSPRPPTSLKVMLGSTLNYFRGTLTGSPRSSPRPSSIPPPYLPPRFQQGSMVATPFGEGRVHTILILPLQLRPIYVVHFLNTTAYVQETNVSWPQMVPLLNPVHTPWGTGIMTEFCDTYGVHCVEIAQLHGNMKVYITKYETLMALYDIPAAVGDTVETSMGTGLVVRYRAGHPAPYVVVLSWDAIWYGSHVKRLPPADSTVNSQRCHVM